MSIDPVTAIHMSAALLATALGGISSAQVASAEPTDGWAWMAARRASRRRFIGVGPAWESCPVAVTCSQRSPMTPVTTPMVVPVFSRMGPCSM